ncbi:MAG: PhoH family protein [Peptococcaceae bacterium]|nr:PhoH family protein [Peptococcaceae bacterium]
MRKIYVVDTSVLLHDPNALFSFADNVVIIPAVVVEEIDGKKHYQDAVGRNAREVARLLDSLRPHGFLHDGIALSNGGLLKVELNNKSMDLLRSNFSEASNDNRILAVTLNYFKQQADTPNPQPVILVSKDVIMRVKADALGIPAQDYLTDKLVNPDELFTGYSEVFVHPSLIDNFYLEQHLNPADLTDAVELLPNQFVLLKDQLGTSKSALARYYQAQNSLIYLHGQSDSVWGIQPRNSQQKMALDLLLNDEIKLVTMTGKAGTGKTLLALAAGLLLTEEENKYQKMLVARPVIPMGKDIGYLPGDKDEKLRPWIQPIYDNLEFLFANRKNRRIEDVMAGLKHIEVEVLTYIRGRSIPQQFIIIDEAQNLTKHEIKTIVSRVGEGSKLVLMGDPAQIDHPYLDSANNGLTYVVEKFKSEPIAGHVSLIKGERSLLAQLAADLL